MNDHTAGEVLDFDYKPVRTGVSYDLVQVQIPTADGRGWVSVRLTPAAAGELISNLRDAITETRTWLTENRPGVVADLERLGAW